MKTLVLCVVTVGAYLIYKLYVYSNQINKHTSHSIPRMFIFTTILLFAVSFLSLIYGLTNFHDVNILRSSIAIHVLSSIFDVTWIILVRNRINAIMGVQKGDELWLNPVVTSVFHVIYMQYKINSGLEKVNQQ